MNARSRGAEGEDAAVRDSRGSFTHTALANDKIGLPFLEGNIHVFEHPTIAEFFRYIDSFDHESSN